MEEVLRGQRNVTKNLVKKWQHADVKGAIAPLLKFISGYPITALFIGVLIGLASLPVVMFVSFVVTTLLFTIFGFVLVEGTLLTIAIFVLSVVLFIVICVSVFVTALLVFTWSSAALWYGVATRMQSVVIYYFPWLNEPHPQQKGWQKKN